ncbi:MAG TPA: response regulator transcription factor, partial [Thermodesulfobacteriota bacterium]|nr:response regulator transcription factor [Thermodesulfobacteriota bacterium]
MVKILIADDHAVVRRGVKQILTEEFDKAVFGEASNGREVLQNIHEQDWDVAILDITLPDRNGLEILEELKGIRPKLSVLVLSIHREEQFAIRAIRAGAAGYLTKLSAPDELVSAVKKIMSGGKYISPSLAEKLATALESQSEKPPHDILSDREYQVACMIASGKTVKEIARELFLSEKT